MKKILLRAIQFLSLAVLFYLLFAFTINRVIVKDARLSIWLTPYVQKTGGQERRMMEDYRADENYKCIVLGSSHAYRGYDPAEFATRGHSLYNCGTSSQNSLGSFCLYKGFLSNPHTQLVIVDLYDRTYENEGFEGVTHLIQNSTVRNVATDLTVKFPDIKTFNVFVSRIFTDHNKQEAELTDYSQNGYCMSADTTHDFPAAVKEKCYVRPLYSHYLDELLTTLDHDKRKYVLVSHPMADVKGARAYHSSFVADVEKIILKHNAPYIDLSFAPGFDTCCYYADKYHLNQAGVSKFNHILLDSLEAEGYLTGK